MLEDFLTLENQLCFSIYEASSQFNKLYSKILQSFGLTYPQYLTLLVLWEKHKEKQSLRKAPNKNTLSGFSSIFHRAKAV